MLWYIYPSFSYSVVKDFQVLRTSWDFRHFPLRGIPDHEDTTTEVREWGMPIRVSERETEKL
jgi:hypothetical protein